MIEEYVLEPASSTGDTIERIKNYNLLSNYIFDNSFTPSQIPTILGYFGATSGSMSYGTYSATNLNSANIGVVAEADASTAAGGATVAVNDALASLRTELDLIRNLFINAVPDAGGRLGQTITRTSKKIFYLPIHSSVIGVEQEKYLPLYAIPDGGLKVSFKLANQQTAFKFPAAVNGNDKYRIGSRTRLVLENIELSTRGHAKVLEEIAKTGGALYLSWDSV